MDTVSGFDPQRLTGDASLQRVVIAALPGVPADVAGRPASEICSRDALAALVVETGGLPPPELDRLGDQLAELRAAAVAPPRELARAALRAYGVRLGALLATLKHSGTPAQQGGTPGRRAYLEHWLGMDRVWLGGGLLAGGGEDVLGGARELLADAGAVLDVRVAPSPTVLPLVGAARLATAHDGRAIVADAGHTSIKAAVAVVEDGALAALEILPAGPAPLRATRHEVEAAIVAVLVRSVRALGRGRRRQVRVVLSVASYVLDGAPVDDRRSIYGGLAPKRIGGLVAAATAATIELEIVHDGTAGAYGVADPGPSAVVTVGTWLGIGFTPSSRPLLGGDPVVCS